MPEDEEMRGMWCHIKYADNSTHKHFVVGELLKDVLHNEANFTKYAEDEVGVIESVTFTLNDTIAIRKEDNNE